MHLTGLKGKGLIGIHSMDHPWEDTQDHDTFISLTGTLCFIVNSRKDKGICAVMLYMVKYVPGVQEVPAIFDVEEE